MSTPRLEVPAGRRPLWAGGILAGLWFVYFAWSGLGVNFAADDMMNLHRYWEEGPLRAITSQVMLGTNVYRPLGALFYLPIYTLFGLNPLPFRIVIFLLLGLNVWLTWKLAARLGAGPLAAFLACLPVAYHGNLADLHYSTAVVYDILCFTFSLAALLLYAGAPISGARRWCILAVLCLCALNSKEMALTLPALLLAYDLLYRRRPQWKALALVSAMTAASLAGKFFGGDALASLKDYVPVFTLQRFLESSLAHADELLYFRRRLTLPVLFGVWAAITWLAWRRPRPELRFAWAMILLTPLPIVFLPNRIHACLYLPLAAWAIFLAIAVVDLARAAAAFLEGEPIVGRLGRTTLFCVLIAFCVYQFARLGVAEKRRLAPEVASHGALTAAVIEQFRTVCPRVPPGAQVLIDNDPFADWDAYFIARLQWRDRGVRVWLQSKTPLPPEEWKNLNYVLRFEGTRLVRVKP